MWLQKHFGHIMFQTLIQYHNEAKFFEIQNELKSKSILIVFEAQVSLNKGLKVNVYFCSFFWIPELRGG